ncbi:MAG: hypothetical protein A2173_10800 [Planctomycetes bacterium RBG_13_44_8b]|nr:MAG: hypothetical protein A2173_10800 [Planctomycetes bacterium RBG_13_44_8b]
MCFKKTGFTLVEVLVASTIGAFIALVAVGALRAVTASAELVENNISVSAELRFALNTISQDLMNLYRDPNYANTRFIGLAEEAEDGYISSLIFYTVSRIKARSSQPEGDVYEVEYNLVREADKSVLMRRCWPYPDKEETEPHGILTVLAEDISMLQVRYYDGEDWTYEWPEEMEVLPQLIEVSLAAKQPGRTRPIVESFMMNFTRSTSMTGVESESTEGTESSTGGTQQSGGGSSSGSSSGGSGGTNMSSGGSKSGWRFC